MPLAHHPTKIAYNPYTERQYHLVATAVTDATGMRHLHGTAPWITVTFYDPETGDFYAVYLQSGYARRCPAGGTWYALNPRSRHPFHCYRPSGRDTYRASVRGTIRYPYDPAALADLVIRAHRRRPRAIAFTLGYCS